MSDACPVCGGKMFWRRYNTPINGKVIQTVAHGCLNCYTATLEVVDDQKRRR